MRVMVRRDASSQTLIDLGEGQGAEAKLRRLVADHGPAVTNEDGTAVELPEVQEEAPVHHGKKKRNHDQ